MGVFRQFPYSNFHEMNMDEILKLMRELQDEWNATKNEWSDMKSFINTYFENLDVSQEISDKINSMVADGSLNTIIDPVIATETANWLAEHITVTEGTTVIDDSLTIHGAAADAKATGDAIENVMANLDSDINDLPYSKLNLREITDGYYLDSNGNEVAVTGWSVSDYLKIGHNTTYYVPVATSSPNVFCWFYNENQEKIESFRTTVRGWNDLVAPATAKFVRFSIETAYKENFEYNSTVLIPYADGAISPNLIEKNKMISSYTDDAYVGYAYTQSGDVDVWENWAMLPLYPVNVGDVFYMDYSFGQYLTCFNENKQFVSAQNASTNGEPIKYTIPNGIAFIGVNLLKARLGTYDLKLNGQPLGAQYKPTWLRSSIWQNKSYISHGDSITWQDGKEYIQGEHIGEIAKGYQTIFDENVGLSRIFNFGKSGWAMAVVNSNGIVNAITQITNYSQFDLCTISAGTNDFKLNVPLGTIGVIGDTIFDDATFYGAYRKAVEYILTNSPTIRLVLMTPLQRDKDGYDVNYINSAGHKLIDYANAIKAVGEMYGLPVCDMYSNSGFTEKTLATYTMDGLHPNDVGYKRIGNYLTGFLNAIGN